MKIVQTIFFFAKLLDPFSKDTSVFRKDWRIAWANSNFEEKKAEYLRRQVERQQREEELRKAEQELQRSIFQAEREKAVKIDLQHLENKQVYPNRIRIDANDAATKAIFSLIDKLPTPKGGGFCYQQHLPPKWSYNASCIGCCPNPVFLFKSFCL